MRHVNRNSLVPYNAREMFVLVDDVAVYPEFLPWCKSAEVHKRTDDLVEATLELRRRAARSSGLRPIRKAPRGAWQEPQSLAFSSPDIFPGLRMRVSMSRK